MNNAELEGWAYVLGSPEELSKLKKIGIYDNNYLFTFFRGKKILNASGIRTHTHGLHKRAFYH